MAKCGNMRVVCDKILPWLLNFMIPVFAASEIEKCMNKISWRFLLLFGICGGSLSSGAQAITHRDELIYYTTIAKQLKNITPDVLKVWGQIKQTLLKAKNSPVHKPEPADISDLKSASSQNIHDLDRAIREVNALDETDSTLSYKSGALSFLLEIKSTEEQAMPEIVLLLTRGIDKINDQQTTALKGFLSRGEELQSRQQQTDNLALRYRQRHNITDEDLRKYGLYF